MQAGAESCPGFEQRLSYLEYLLTLCRFCAIPYGPNGFRRAWVPHQKRCGVSLKCLRQGFEHRLVIRRLSVFDTLDGRMGHADAISQALLRETPELSPFLDEGHTEPRLGFEPRNDLFRRSSRHVHIMHMLNPQFYDTPCTIGLV